MMPPYGKIEMALLPTAAAPLTEGSKRPFSKTAGAQLFNLALEAYREGVVESWD